MADIMKQVRVVQRKRQVALQSAILVTFRRKLKVSCSVVNAEPQFAYRSQIIILARFIRIMAI